MRVALKVLSGRPAEDPDKRKLQSVIISSSICIK